MSADIDSSIAQGARFFRPNRKLPATSAGARLAAMARNRPTMVAMIATALLGIAAYAGLRSEHAVGPAYVTAIVQRSDIEDSVTALGNLQPRDYVDVGAQATGQLKKLYVDIGDAVKQGQLLADIDPQVASAKVAQDKGNLANLKAQLADR